MAELLFFLQVALSLGTHVSRFVPRARLRIYIKIIFKFEIIYFLKMFKAHVVCPFYKTYIYFH